MEIAVAHHSLNIPGGAERLCLAVIEALRKRGHNVALITVEKTDWRIVQKNFGNVTMPNRESYLTSNRVSANLSSIPTASTYFLTYVLQLLASRSKGKYDLTMNIFGDIINSIADLTYVHFPLRAAIEFSQIPAFSKQSMWQAIAPVYYTAAKILDRICPGELLTNSMFTQEIIRKTLNRKSLVVYPPVDVEAFSTRCFETVKRGCTVAVVASYTPKRHLEQIPLIAKYARAAEFVVIGKADEYSFPVLTKLRALISDFHVGDRVKLLTNVPFEGLLEMLSKAKVYLHVMPYDHFGISVVEAMASGCVPVVHRSGGPWLDILNGEQGNYGYSYTNAEEAASAIDRLVTDENSRERIAFRSRCRASTFDRTVFMKRIVEVIEQVEN